MSARKRRDGDHPVVERLSASLANHGLDDVAVWTVPKSGEPGVWLDFEGADALAELLEGLEELGSGSD